MTYDSLNQLTAERGRAFSAFSITYAYDPVGNRLTKLQSGVTTTYTYDAADELTLEDAAGELTTYAYDENGNTLLINAAGERTTLTWSYEDEALVIHAPEHVPVTMTYNGDHMRRRRQDANAIINYLWDGAQAFIETQSQDAALARYTLAPFGYGDLVSQRRSDATRFYHFDAIGSTRALSDSAEAVTDTYAYEAFGKRIATSGATTNPYQWIAKLGYLGEGRLDGYLLRRRYYRTGPGRWVSRDPRGEAGAAYAYGGNSPLWGADPSGLQVMGPVPPGPGFGQPPPSHPGHPNPPRDLPPSGQPGFPPGRDPRLIVGPPPPMGVPIEPPGGTIPPPQPWLPWPHIPPPDFWAPPRFGGWYGGTYVCPPLPWWARLVPGARDRWCERCAGNCMRECENVDPGGLGGAGLGWYCACVIACAGRGARCKSGSGFVF